MSDTVPKATEEQIDYILKRGVAELIVEDELRWLLHSGKKLRLKEGFDPSSADIHLGHMVTLRKLRQLQELGHRVVLIVGDWTAQIGDPSGASITRPMLTAEQVKTNAQTYMDQFFKIVDRNRAEVRWQTEWFGNFNLGDIIRLASKFTVAKIMAREDFNQRFTSGKPITMAEIMYPMLQAYDSVMVQSDVEFGGTDQKFNLLMGRELQTMVGQRPQQVFMTPVLIGTDGVHKMSKSIGNYVGVAEPPDKQYGKIMSIQDTLIIDYFELLTDVPDKEINEFKQALKDGSVNPMEIKKRLAREIVTQLNGKEAAQEAEDYFVRTVQKKELPDEIEDLPIKSLVKDAKSGQKEFKDIDIGKLLIAGQKVKSRGEASRLIEQGAVSIDGKKLEAPVTDIKIGSIIKIGKRRFAKIV